MFDENLFRKVTIVVGMQYGSKKGAFRLIILRGIIIQKVGKD